MRCIALAVAVFLSFPAWATEVKANKPRIADSSPARNGGADGGYKEIAWDELVPKGWDPAERFRQIDLSALKDSDPRAMELLVMMKNAWDKAPIDPSLDGKRVKIPGFVVPIEGNARAVSEFLLVPYFGACIHVPPPPANQIIHVISARPIKGLRVMDVVWVAGELKTIRFSKQTDMGVGASGYQINSVSVTPYKESAIVTLTPYNPGAEWHRVPKRTPP